LDNYMLTLTILSWDWAELWLHYQ